MNPTSHIIVFRLSAMGDVAMAVPVLRAFTKQYPQVGITMVSRPLFKPFFDIPNVDFLGFDAKDRHRGAMGILRLYSDLRKLNPTAFADFHNVLRSKIVGALFKISGVKTAVFDKDRQRKKMLTRADNKIFEPLKPVVDKYTDVFAALGFPVKLDSNAISPKYPLDSDVLNITGSKTNTWIGIAPFAQHNAKVYPSNLMQQVIERLSEQTSTIFLFGSGAVEIANLELFAKSKPNVIVIAGKLTLAQELQIISNLDVMLSMDSGNAHMAAMFGIPVVTLWGATHPYAGFSPFNQPAENALTSDRTQYPLLPTSIYGNKIIEGYEDVMRTISPQSVVDRIQAVIGQ